MQVPIIKWNKIYQRKKREMISLESTDNKTITWDFDIEIQMVDGGLDFVIIYLTPAYKPCSVGK